jgi:RNA polymerase sigma factor (sigma-70 family)
VDELREEREPTSSLRSVSLSQLSRFSLQTRSASLLRDGLDHFELALRTLHDVGIVTTMDAQRLAWAVAFNVDGMSVSEPGDLATQRSGGCYRDRWPLDATWPAVWSVLVRPLAQDDSSHSATLLSELALSVACEQREDWQNPSARPIEVAIANRTFEFVYKKNRLKVLGVCRRFADRVGDPEAIADEAWSRVFCDYWSTHARRRFLGLSRISTLVSQVARHIAIDSIRGHRLFVSKDENLNSDESALDIEDSRAVNPAASMEANQLSSRIEECMSRLPPKRRIVADMVWLRQMNAKRVAQILGVSEPAISQHLKKARDTVGKCLKEQGFNVPE